jgi:hypothetical protein
VVDLIVLVTVFLAAGAALVPLTAVVFLTTVAVLASLDSLVTLTFRLPRVTAVDGGGIAALRVRPVAVVAVVAVAPALELAVEDAVVFLVVAAGRVALALSTILDKIFEDLVVGAFTGDAGRLIIDLIGEAGRSLGTTRVFEDVGDRICDAVIGALGWMTAPRSLFLGLSIGSPWFSLSAPEISLLNTVSLDAQRSCYEPHLNLFCPRAGLAVGTGFRGIGLGDVPSFAGTGGGLVTY